MLGACNDTSVIRQGTGDTNSSTNETQGPTWLSGKVFDSSSRGPGFEPHWILWVFSWECPWARHFIAKPRTGETQESMNNVSCRRDTTKILLKAA